MPITAFRARWFDKEKIIPCLLFMQRIQQHLEYKQNQKINSQSASKSHTVPVI